MSSNQEDYIRLDLFFTLFNQVNDHIAIEGYEISFEDVSFLDEITSIVNEALERGDIKELRSIEFKFLIFLEKGYLEELKHNIFVDFSLIFYYDGKTLRYGFSPPRIANIVHSKRVHKFSVDVTFTRNVRTPVLERLFNEKCIKYERPIRSRMNIEREIMKGIDVTKYLI
jgi:hypothetical protein